MNYSIELKKLETNLTTLQATIIAKKQNIEEMLEKKKKVEKECKDKFNISIEEVPSKIQSLNDELEKGIKSAQEKVNKIESEFARIK